MGVIVRVESLGVDDVGAVVGAVGEDEAAVCDGVVGASLLLGRGERDACGALCGVDLVCAAGSMSGAMGDVVKMGYWSFACGRSL